MTITVTLTNPRHIAAANAAYQMTIPEDPETPAPYASVEAYVQASLEQVCDSWADTTGVDKIAVAAFVRRFPGPVMDAIVAAAPGDPHIRAILDTIDRVTHVRLGAQTTIDAMAYLVAAGYLGQAQAGSILEYG